MAAYLGLMIGSSADGIDAALIECDSKHCTLLGEHTQALEPSIREKILAFSINQEGSIQMQCTLDAVLGRCLADAAEALLDKIPYPIETVQAVGVHGATCLHQPTDATAPTSIQLGDPNIIAAQLNRPVVSDFRRADIASGGQGAPLTPAFHHFWWHQSHLGASAGKAVVVNIGGMANITAWPDGQLMGFDTGPGNVLMDAWIQSQQGLMYDADGVWAASGQVIPELLSCFQKDPYFSEPWPKSTSRQYFNLGWIQAHLNAQTSHAPEDVQATLCALTAWSVAQAVQACVVGCDQIWICGGGVHNAALMQALSEHCPGCAVASTAKAGWSPDAVEASAFAWLAYLRLKGQSARVASVTGAQRQAVLGGVYQPA